MALRPCAGWVGDQDPTFDGLKEALKRFIKSGADRRRWHSC
jgi:hypothetical protein